MVANRKYIQQLIFDAYDALDPSGTNTDKNRAFFESMSDDDAEKFFKEFLADDDENFTLDISEFEHEIKMDYCEKCAKLLGIPLMEDIYMPHLTMDKNNVVVSKEKCLTGYMNSKRTQQFVHKKNGLSSANTKISSLTNQVVDRDKNARDSDIEASLLVSLGANHILQELHGPRSDDTVMKRQMHQSIATKGYVLLDDLENVSTNKVTLNTVNTYFLCMGLKTDLVSDTYILPKLSEEMFD